MSISLQQKGHLFETRQKSLQISRERSLALMRQAQQTHSRHKNHYQSKETSLAEQELKNQRIAIIKEIQSKLAQNVWTKQEVNQVPNVTLADYVMKPSRLMEQMKSVQPKSGPKTVFMREEVPMKTQSKENHQDKVTQSRQRLRLLLNEIQKAREEVKEIHLWNEKIIGKTNSYRQPSLSMKNKHFTAKPFEMNHQIRVQDSLNVRKQDEQDSDGIRDRAGIKKQESLIQKLANTPQQATSSKDSLVVEEEFNSETVIKDLPNNQSFYPSEVILSWKKGEGQIRSTFEALPKRLTANI